MKTINYLLGYKDMHIVQDDDMFKFSLDSVLLSKFVTLNPNTKEILDIGTGNAPIPLFLSRRTSAHITGIELQKEVFDMALESVKLNNLEKQITILNGDIKEYQTDTKYDIIISNPPYFKVNTGSNLNVSEYKTLARHEVSLDLEGLIKAARRLLKTSGVLAFVHRTERLVDIIETLKSNNIEPKKVQFIYPKFDSESNLVLVEGTLNGKSGLKILKPIYVYNETNEYTDDIKKILSE